MLTNKNTVINYFNTLPEQRVTPDIQPGYLQDLIPSQPPTSPEPWQAIQTDLDSKIKPGLTHWQSPNFMAFFPASVTYPSILGELYSAAFTAPAFNWLCSPACTELETIVMDWVAQALSLPPCFLSTAVDDHGRPSGGGVIQVSASDAIATVMVAARERRIRDIAIDDDGLVDDGGQAFVDRTMDLRPRLVALGSDQAHSSTAKGAMIAGTRYRSVPTSLDTNLEMTGDALRHQLLRCDHDGLIPYYLTVTMGSTSTCAVDRMGEIQAVLAERPAWQRIWVHVDAAYAGAALVADEYKALAGDLGFADSFNMNMHKWLLVNFDASCLFVRARRDLINALDVTPAYLRNAYSETGRVIDYRNWSISLGRRFRALKIWFVMRSYGLTGLAAHIRQTVAVGETFATLVRSRPDLFDIVARPAFGLTVFQVRQPSSDGPDASNVTRKVYELVNSRGDLFITSSVVAGVYAIRVVSATTQEAYVRRAFEIVVEAAERERRRG